MGTEFDPKTYAGWRATTLGRITERLEVDLVLSLARIGAGDRVLDIGTGDGTYAIAAARRGGVVSAVDTSQAMLDAAAERAREARGRWTFRSGRRARCLSATRALIGCLLSRCSAWCRIPDARSLSWCGSPDRGQRGGASSPGCAGGCGRGRTSGLSINSGAWPKARGSGCGRCGGPCISRRWPGSRDGWRGSMRG